MYLDANFFVIARFNEGQKAVNARKLIKKIEKGTVAITSSLALDEVMWTLIKNKKKHFVRDVIKQIYSTKNLEVKEVSPLIPMRALDFMDEFNLQPRDAFHVAVMEEFGQNQIVSDDRDFDKIPAIKRIKF